MQVVRRLSAKPGWILLPLLLMAVWLAREPLYALYIDWLGWVYAQMKSFHAMLTESVGQLADNPSPATAMALIVGSFLYGVFHAAGPGHGKVILSTYLLSQPEKIKKSVGLAVASSLVQGIVAIILVYGLFYLFGLVSRDMKVAVAWSERLAYAVVAALGVALMLRGLKAVYAQMHPATNTQSAHNHGPHEHSHEDHGHHHHALGHHHHGADGVCTTCGHAHVPTNNQIDTAKDWRTSLAVILSIGMRPCTGAVLVLVFARFSGVSWAGAAAVLAMSMGTAITVSLMAMAAVGAREFALRMLGSSNGLVGTLGNFAAIIGGLVLTAMGLGLIVGSFDAPMRSMGL
ncbi:MAG: nickel/cobalt transporter [Rhizobiaceae bacterium]